MTSSILIKNKQFINLRWNLWLLCDFWMEYGIRENRIWNIWENFDKTTWN